MRYISSGVIGCDWGHNKYAVIDDIRSVDGETDGYDKRFWFLPSWRGDIEEFDGIRLEDVVVQGKQLPNVLGSGQSIFQCLALVFR